jgi:ATP-dependent RNA helicase DDX21
VHGQEIKTSTTVDHLALNCPKNQRIETVADVVLCYGGRHSRTIIFTETKRDCNDIKLKANLKQECEVLHGDIP